MISRKFLHFASVVTCLIAGASGVAVAQQPPGAVAGPAYSTSTTDIGTLIDNEQTKAVLDMHVPNFSSNPQIAMTRAMTLKQIQGFAGDALTDEVLAKIDADLAKVPASK